MKGQVSVPLLTDKSETENVQVKGTVNDVGLDEIQGLGGFGPETVHVGGSGGLGGVGSETMQDGVSEVVEGVGPETMHVGENMHVGSETMHVGENMNLGLNDGLNEVQTDVVPETMQDGGSHGQRDVGPDNVAVGGSKGLTDAGPNTVAGAGNEGVTNAGPNTPGMLGLIICQTQKKHMLERALGADDGFMHPEVGQAEAELNDKVRMMKEKKGGNIGSPDRETVGETSARGGRGGRSGRGGRGGRGRRGGRVGVEHRGQNDGGNVETFAPPDMENMHIMEEDYETEELHSDAESSDRDGGPKPRYPRFHKEDMCKQFKWKVGMEFASLLEFKDAMLEHSLLNGKEIKFVKNDLVRARAVCTRKCPFTVLCSKVGGSETFRIKTLVGRWYKRTAYELTYGQVIAPINGEQLWPKTGGELILPPAYKPSTGRPKKLRRREPDESQNPTRLRRGGNTTRCGRCQNLGHNSRNCTTPHVNPAPEPQNPNEDVVNGAATETGTQQTPQATANEDGAQGAGSQVGTQQSHQATGKRHKAHPSQHDKGKSKITYASQQSQTSQGITRVTRNSQKSQQTQLPNDTGAGSSKAKNKRKADSQPKKGAHTHKRGKKKSLTPGPVIPEFARNMSIGQLLTQLTRVWETHVGNVKAAASTQAADPPSQGPLAAPTEAEPATTREPTITREENHEETRDAVGGQVTGEATNEENGNKD
ncbi:Transposase, MuDR, plant [Sesbania bispinosa]|nr:Transposase, MuDR, plant [Sesbania bispinosa]